MVVATEEPGISVPNLEKIVLSQVEPWLAQCQSFRKWYRENFLLRDPSPDQEGLADEIQPWMIRLTRGLLAHVSDPEFPHQHLASSVRGTLWQLEEDWAARHNPLSETQAKEFMAAFFPQHA